MHIDLKTQRPDVLAHITWPESEKYPKKLRGHAIDRNGVRIDGAQDVCRTVNRPEELEAKKQMIANIIGQNCLSQVSTSHAHHTSSNVLDDANPMVVAYQRVNDHPEFLSGWSEVTAHAALTQFQRQILPTLSKYGTAEYPIFTETDLDDLKKDLLARIAENGNSKGSPKINNRTMLQTLAASQKIYDAMVRFDPMLPDISLSAVKTIRRIASEQMKALPPKVRERFIELLDECMANEPLMVRQVSILVDAGPRTAEAAAVIPALDFVDIEGVTSLYVAWQEKGGKRCAKLKTKNGYRYVPLSMWGKTMVADVTNFWGLPQFHRILHAPLFWFLISPHGSKRSCLRLDSRRKNGSSTKKKNWKIQSEMKEIVPISILQHMYFGGIAPPCGSTSVPSRQGIATICLDMPFI